MLLLLATLQSMLGKHDEALATVEAARAQMPEARDAINGPQASFVRSVILVRAGRTEEGYAGQSHCAHGQGRPEIRRVDQPPAQAVNLRPGVGEAFPTASKPNSLWPWRMTSNPKRPAARI